MGLTYLIETESLNLKESIIDLNCIVCLYIYYLFVEYWLEICLKRQHNKPTGKNMYF